MKLRLDKTLREQLEVRGIHRRLRRNSGIVARDAAIAKTLCDLKSRGDAMRYLDRNGYIAWRATPKLKDYIDDLKSDAEADYENERV